MTDLYYDYPDLSFLDNTNFEPLKPQLTNLILDMAKNCESCHNMVSVPEILSKLFDLLNTNPNLDLSDENFIDNDFFKTHKDNIAVLKENNQIIFMDAIHFLEDDKLFAGYIETTDGPMNSAIPIKTNTFTPKTFIIPVKKIDDKYQILDTNIVENIAKYYGY